MTQDTPPQQQLPLPVILIGLVLMVLGVLAARYVLSPHQQASPLPSGLKATYLQDGKPITGFSLVDYNKQRFDASRFKGKWTFLFFGYTNCPDVCPTTMLVMKSVWAKLPAEAMSAPAPQLVFVSVDPDRDTPERLKKYVTFYRPDFLGVTGNADQIDILTKQVGVLYGFDDDPDGKGYTVKHSAQIILVDPTGKERAVFSPPHKVDDIVRSFVEIRNYYKG
jgi:protein SCO1/2